MIKKYITKSKINMGLYHHPASFIQQFQVIIGHGPNCNDGATAMWACWRTLSPEYREALSKEGGFYSKPCFDTKFNDKDSIFVHPNSVAGAIRLQNKGFPIVFVFSQPGMNISDQLVRGKNVLVLDLDLGDSIVPLVEAANYVYVCDHHDTSQSTIHKHSDLLLNTHQHKFSHWIDVSKKECGATMAWRLTHSAEIPPFVQVVRIGDTWQWHEYPELQSKLVLRTFYVERAFRSFIDIEETFQSWNVNFDRWVEQGRSIYEYETALVKQASKQCDIGSIHTNDGSIYNVAYVQSNLLVSEIGTTIRWYAEQRFKTKIDFCAVWKYNPRRDLVTVSLRDPIPGLKLGQIARNVRGSSGTGGGHDSAACFSFQGLHRFREFILATTS